MAPPVGFLGGGPSQKLPPPSTSKPTHSRWVQSRRQPIHPPPGYLCGPQKETTPSPSRTHLGQEADVLARGRVAQQPRLSRHPSDAGHQLRSHGPRPLGKAACGGWTGCGCGGWVGVAGGREDGWGPSGRQPRNRAARQGCMGGGRTRGEHGATVRVGVGVGAGPAVDWGAEAGPRHGGGEEGATETTSCQPVAPALTRSNAAPAESCPALTS